MMQVIVTEMGDHGLCLDRLERNHTPCSALFEGTNDPTGHVDFCVLVGREERVLEELGIGRAAGRFLGQAVTPR